MDTAALFTYLGEDAASKDAAVQLPNKKLDTPSTVPITTTRTRELLMNKLPHQAKTAFTVPCLPHNILAGAELVDAGCTLYLDKHMAEIELEGEVLYRGWRDRPSRLWKFNIDPNDCNRLMPMPDNEILDTKAGTIMATMQYDVKAGMVLSAVHDSMAQSINALYECTNKEELIKYLHASLCSHPKTTLIAAARTGYLHGFPALTAEAIGKYVKVEEATECGHMQTTPRGTCSTSKPTARGRPK